jgi:hypothetical protein
VTKTGVVDKESRVSMSLDEIGDERKATERARWLARKTDMNRKVAEAVAWSELGFSAAGIAKKVDRAESTVKGYLEQAGARYGLEAMWARTEYDKHRELDAVEPGHHRTFESEQRRDAWIELFNNHADRLPQEWVNEVREELAEDGLN